MYLQNRVCGAGMEMDGLIFFMSGQLDYCHLVQSYSVEIGGRVHCYPVYFLATLLLVSLILFWDVFEF